MRNVKDGQVRGKYTLEFKLGRERPKDDLGQYRKLRLRSPMRSDSSDVCYQWLPMFRLDPTGHDVRCGHDEVHHSFWRI